MVLYTLPGNPIPLARPRFGKNKIFDSQKLLKVNHGIILKRIHGNRELYEGPLFLEATFYLPVHKKHSAKLKKKMIGAYRDKRPDLDNLIKYILHTANRILFRDDALISVIHAQKVYDTKPRTEFTITEI